MKKLWDWLKLINFAVELEKSVLTKNEKNKMNSAKYELDKVAAMNLYVAGCQQMAEIVNNRYFEGCADIHWIGDRYDLCDFSGEWWLTPDEMRQMLESDLSQEDFFEWWDYNLSHAYTPINLGSWIMGLRPEYKN